MPNGCHLISMGNENSTVNYVNEACENWPNSIWLNGQILADEKPIIEIIFSGQQINIGICIRSECSCRSVDVENRFICRPIRSEWVYQTNWRFVIRFNYPSRVSESIFEFGYSLMKYVLLLDASSFGHKKLVNWTVVSVIVIRPMWNDCVFQSN